MELKDLYFKVKKVSGKINTVGLICPVFKNNYTECFISENYFNLICFDGQILNDINKNNIEFSNTRIMDKNIKMLMDEICICEKNKYTQYKEILKLKSALKEKDKNNCILTLKVKEILKQIVQSQGYIVRDVFDELIHKEIVVPNNYQLDFNIDKNVINAIMISNEFYLGKYIQEGKYSFLYYEYDGVLMPDCEDLEKNSSFLKIKNAIFKNPKDKILNKYDVSVDYSVSTGDKNSASIFQEIIIENIDIELKRCNLPHILNILKETFIQLT